MKSKDNIKVRRRKSIGTDSSSSNYKKISRYFNVRRNFLLRGRTHASFQRSVVKVSYKKNDPSKSWKSHGKYLERETVQREKEGNVTCKKGFDEKGKDSDIGERVDKWQSGDNRYFRIMISPEYGQNMDLKNHALKVMKEVSSRLDTPLEWSGIVHRNTDQPHIHIVLRGIDEKGNDLRIPKDMICGGIRKISQLEATREIGPRLRDKVHEKKQRELDVKRPYQTAIDRQIQFDCDKEGIFLAEPSEDHSSKNKLARLQWLEEHGLSKHLEGNKWRLNPFWMQNLTVLDKCYNFQKTSHLGLDRKNFDLKFVRPEEQALVVGCYRGSAFGDEDKRFAILDMENGTQRLVPCSTSVQKAMDKNSLIRGDYVLFESRIFVDKETEKEITYYSHQNMGDLEKIKNSGVSKELEGKISMSSLGQSKNWEETQLAQTIQQSHEKKNSLDFERSL